MNQVRWQVDDSTLLEEAIPVNGLTCLEGTVTDKKSSCVFALGFKCRLHALYVIPMVSSLTINCLLSSSITYKSPFDFRFVATLVEQTVLMTLVRFKHGHIKDVLLIDA